MLVRLKETARAIERTLNYVCNIANSVGKVVIFLMVLLVAADIILRYIFNRPIKGSYEIVEVMLVVVVFCGLAYAQTKKKHITIDLVTNRLSAGAKAVVNSATYLLCLSGFSIITWRSILEAQVVQAGGLITGQLPLPVFPFIWVIVFGSTLLSIVFLVDFVYSLAGVFRNCSKSWLWMVLTGVVVLILAAFPWWFDWLPWGIDRVTAGLIGIGLMVFLIFTGMPIGMVMLVTGFLGLSYLINPGASLGSMGLAPFRASSNYTMSTIPLFVLMGVFCYHAELSRDIYGTFNKWMGQLPGGLAMATTAACAAFGAVSGSGQATAMTMATVSLPEMRKYGYDDGLACGSVAAGGMLAILIPPSIIFIIYALLTEQSVGKLFMAGILPGILLAALLMITIYIQARHNPRLAPRGQAATFKEKLVSLRGTWGILILFFIVMGGIYAGIFTPTEAGGFGAFGALIIGLSARRLNRKSLLMSLSETVDMTSVLFLLLIGVQLFNQFVTMSQLPWSLADIILSLPVSNMVILIAIIIFYIAVGFILPIMPIIVLSIPVFYPVVAAMGFDLIWFGVIIMMMVETGAITPPMALNCFLIARVSNVPLPTIYRGVLPFVLTSLVCIVVLIAFPEISLFLPRMMMGHG